MKRSTHAPRLATIIASLAFVVMAAFSLVVAPQRVWAEPTYASEPIEGVADQPGSTPPGFKWVDPQGDEPGHYLIYNPVEGFEGSHESGIGWWYFANYSRDHDFDGYLIKLDSDLIFTDYDFARDGGDPNQLSVGSEDRPFMGTFDGAGHTISNLDNRRDGLSIQLDNGFFGWTNAATIKNITFKNCYIGGSYRDGLVAGYAQDTFFLNITAEDCTTSVIPANNVLNLITNAGISGGTIAGVANGCTLYNCEMRGGRVVTNATAGVAALGGQPLYMGGLVGQANDTTIEYSRVTDKWVEAEGGTKKTRDYAEVSGTYETAVSVANYSEVFVGGIVGGMQKEDTGTKIVDCYSTADVYGKAAIYFGVGLGLGVTRAYCGGIAGIVWDGGNGRNLIERVHYAGNLHSYQYNQLLLGIPIIQHDAYMGGIVSVGGGNATINQAYFKRGASSTNAEILSYQNWTTDTDGPADGGVFGPRDASYTDRDYWEGCDFDFAGGTVRNYGYKFTEDLEDDEWSSDHYNKWVMDYNRGIPVHGGSIKATLDFPGSGEVTIGYTSLAWDENDAASGVGDGANAQKTTNPYDFTVQGFEQGDKTITLQYALNEDNKNVSWAADEANEGFRIIGWYGTRDVQVNAIPASHSYFTSHNTMLDTDECGQGILSTAKGEGAGALGDAHASDAKHLVKANDNKDADAFDLAVNWPIGDEAAEDWRDPDVLAGDAAVESADADGSGDTADAGAGDAAAAADTRAGEGDQTKPRYPEYADNDLYIAHAQAQVLLHDVAGKVIKANGTAEETADTSDDWYEYEQTLTLPTTVAADAGKVGTDVTFVGWTTRPVSGGAGYANATPTDIQTLRGENALFEPGARYAVTQPVNLYPVYVGLTGNVKVIFEGNDQDPADDGAMYEGGNDVSKRDGYGQAVVRTDENGAYIALDDIVGTSGVDATNNAIDLTTSPLHASYDAGDTATSPDGAQMRFLGWYETVTENGKTFEVRVSDEPTFHLTDVDLTQQHTYTARFEYCVRYWWGAGDANTQNYKPYSLDWVRYGADRHDPSLDGEGVHTFHGWYTGGNASNSYVLNPGDASPVHANGASSSVSTITFPLSFHGTWDSTIGANVEVHTDFPTGPSFTLEFGGGVGDNVILDMPGGNDNGFKFHLWTGECDVSGWQAQSTDTRWDASRGYIDGNRHYWFQAHVTADVSFHGVGGSTVGTMTVLRRYETPVFSDEAVVYPVTHEYAYHYRNDGTGISVTQGAAPTDTEMARSGYIFLGWIDKNLISQDEFDYIFNGAEIAGTDVKLVKDVDRALPYLVTSTDTIEVRHPMDFYPVYVGFDLETTTNIAQAGVDKAVYNIPGDPGITDAADPAGSSKVSVSYNRDGGTLLGDASSPVDITYDADGSGVIDLTVDVNKPVWKESSELTPEQKAERYTLVSLTVTKDGALVDTLYPASIGEDAATYTFEDYTIEPGSTYEFCANYEPVPVMVTYHLGTSATDPNAERLDTFTCEVGDLLPATAQTPWFKGYDDDDTLAQNQFFIGWTVGEAEGEPAEWVADGNPVLARPNVDAVTGTTHLWPVYRESEIQPTSNIDTADGVGTSHRRATKHAGDPTNLWLEADEVPGYEFKGWTTNYNDDGTYDLFTTSAQTALSGDVRFDTSVTYTAIYEEVAAQVRYHDMDGNVIYTASVAGEGSAWNPDDPTSDPADNPDRSFVYDAKADHDGNPDTPEVDVKMPIDVEAFTAIYAAVDAKNAAAGASTYMTFVTWQLVDTQDGTPERWGAADDENSFVNQSVSTLVTDGDNTLDLYPIVATIETEDPDGNAYTALTPQLDLDTMENKINAANITLRESYDDAYLRVHLEELAYAPGAGDTVTSERTPLEGVAVKLYGVGSSMGEPLASDTTRSEQEEVDLPSGDSVSLNKGDAIFTFSGFINITKRTQDANAACKTFTFTVSEADGAGAASASRKVTVKVGETASNGWYTGSVKIAVPFGTYTVSEDDGWAWRYDVKLEKWNKPDNGSYEWADTNNNAEVTVTYTSEVSAGNPDGATSSVRAINTRDNNKWSDGSDYRHNVFNQAAEGSGE